MQRIRIIALHLAFGGIEKAIISMANLFVEKYDVEIICVYNMPESPAFPLDGRVKIRYLLDETPNREEWKDAIRRKNVYDILRESIKSVRVLTGKKKAVRKTISDVHDGILITTRHEDNLALSTYGDKKVLKIAQLHHDHRFDRKLMRDFRNRYDNIDVFALLASRLVDEVAEMMPDNKHTKLVSIPNFLADYPESVQLEKKEKIVLAVGRLDTVKGFDRLIKAFSLIHEKAPDWQLRIVGEGNERTRLENLINEYDAAGYITMTGRLSGDGVREEMLRASLFAMSSYSEGFPYVLLEAQSCGLPCVAFDVRVGPRLILTDGVNGCLVKDGDMDGYVRRTVELLHAESIRRKMAQEAIFNAGLYSKDALAKIWNAVLEGNYD